MIMTIYAAYFIGFCAGALAVIIWIYYENNH